METLVPMLLDLDVGKLDRRLQDFQLRRFDEGPRYPSGHRHDEISLGDDRRQNEKMRHRQRDAALDALRGNDVFDRRLVTRAGRRDEHMRDLAELLGRERAVDARVICARDADEIVLIESLLVETGL